MTDLIDRQVLLKRLNELRAEDCDSEITHGEWRAMASEYHDDDGFWTLDWSAVHRLTGERRILQHSRFSFHMTKARFRWLVDNDFPSPPGKGPWTDAAIDAAMEDGA